MNLGGYNFIDPEKIGAADSIDRATVYVVMTHDGISWFYLYVGQTGDLAERFDQHEKWNCWLIYQKSGGLYVAFTTISDRSKRFIVETHLRKTLPGLPCNIQ